MKTNLCRIRKPLQVLAGAWFVASTPALAPSTCRAQEAPTAPGVVAPQAMPLLDENTLENEKSLQAPVTFEAQRQKLSQVLSSLQAQSGVTLAVAPDSPLASKLLTARAKAMPLAKVLGSLSRLYGVGWAKQGEAFEMKGNGRSAIENMLWKIRSTQGNVSKSVQADPIDWSQEVPAIGVKQLQRKYGVPFAEWPEEVAQKLRAQSDDQNVLQLGTFLNDARLHNIEGGSLQASSVVEKVYGEGEPKVEILPGQVQITIALPDGRPIDERTLGAKPATPGAK